MLFDPRILHYNVALFAISLTVGALLPALVGYTIGDHAVKSKGKLRHHFNGILFGLLAYGIMMLVAVLTPIGLFAADPKMRIVLLNILPSIGVAIITTILAVAHVRSRKAARDILDYKPYSILLIAVTLALPVWQLVDSIVMNRVDGYSFEWLIVAIVFGVISYLSLRKVGISGYNKFTWSAVSVSVLFVASFIMPQLLFAVTNYLQMNLLAEGQNVVYVTSLLLALVGWFVYWVTQVRLLRRNT